MAWYVWLILIIIIVVIIGYFGDKVKREKLMEKYNDKALVDRLMKKQFWQGMPAGQLVDSVGKPLEKSTKVLKTKTKETWKYNKTGTNRYALKIFLENGIVIGWEKK